LAPQMLWGQAAPESAVREAIVSRLEALQSIIVEYDAEHSFFPRGSLSDAPGMHIKTGTDRSNERYLYCKGSARWEKTLTRETVETERLQGIPILQTVVVYFASGGFEQMDVRTDQPLGSIETRLLPPQLQ